MLANLILLMIVILSIKILSFVWKWALQRQN